MSTMAFLRRHLRPINILSGALLAGFGVLMITNQLFRLSSWVIDVMEEIPILDRLTAI
jgi:hypothetical protein